MGQKVHPFVQRIGLIRTWQSRWFANPRDYARFVAEDQKIRKHIFNKFKQALVARVIIERLTEKVKVRICSARPGIIIGRHGADIEKLREDLFAIVKKETSIDIEEIKNPGTDAQLVAQNISFQIEKRVGFRRTVKRAIEQAMMQGAKGIKITVAGRLDGAEMCRTETYKQGKVPLQTFRADIMYGQVECLTTYGLIGIKVWVYHGDILIKKNVVREKPAVEQAGEVKQKAS
ncbi:MAG: 30S ribosomal protein S3 [Candidatus Omnitrophica bacterium]|jgi:small subunit ribosomal protein S3|nr:30S ribosomal protein S3 [Candidatus Omnitrophota bacterium]MDD5079102.1 30S ribosomal protein S3 [Candidatus Omnitrophota bacterium]